MDSMFLVTDDIDLSDDDFEADFSLGKFTQFNCTSGKDILDSSVPASSLQEDIPDTVPVTQNHAYRTISKYAEQQKPANNFFMVENNTNKRFSINDNAGSTKNQSGDNIFDNFENDDTDELMSQIDLPMDKKEDSVTMHKRTQQNPKPNPIKQLCDPEDKMDEFNSNEYYLSNKSFPKGNICNDKRESGHSSKHPFNNIGKSQSSSATTDLPMPFCTKAASNSNFTPAYSVRSCEDTTPNKLSTGRRNTDTTPIKISRDTLTPNVAPHSNKRKASHEKPTPKQRRFPGPAGILPSINNLTSLEQLKSPETGKGKRTLTPITPKTPIESIISNSQDDDFTESIWMDVRKQVCRLFPHRTCEPISKILQEATQNQLNNRKVALFCGLIKSFTISGSGGKLVLKDPSGEINGTIHKNVLDEYEPELHQGTGLILKDISVFSPSLRKHYINITPSNIVQMFPAEMNEVLSTQSQSTQPPQNNRGKENVAAEMRTVERPNKSVGNIFSDEPGAGSNDKSSDLFGNDDSDDNFLMSCLS